MSEIVEQLRFLGLTDAADEIERLSAEIERLRALITAWADAWDEQATDTQGEGSYHEVTVRRIDTGDELRKAVGR